MLTRTGRSGCAYTSKLKQQRCISARSSNWRVVLAVVSWVCSRNVQLGHGKMPARIRCNIIIVRVLPGISDAEGVLVAKQMKDFGPITLPAPGLRVVRLRKAKALGAERSALSCLVVDLRIVYN